MKLMRHKASNGLHFQEFVHQALVCIPSGMIPTVKVVITPMLNLMQHVLVRTFFLRMNLQQCNNSTMTHIMMQTRMHRILLVGHSLRLQVLQNELELFWRCFHAGRDKSAAFKFIIWPRILRSDCWFIAHFYTMGSSFIPCSLHLFPSKEPLAKNYWSP